jgi:CTP-dependent riboflavin kinase
MHELLIGRLQAGKNDASHWLSKFNEAYSRKAGMSIFPGSLNLALDHPFDWFAPRYQERILWFGRDEYGGERDILLLPCELVSLDARAAFLWTPTTAARNRPDPCVIEIITDVGLRRTYGLTDGDIVSVKIHSTAVAPTERSGP